MKVYQNPVRTVTLEKGETLRHVFIALAMSSYDTGYVIGDQDSEEGMRPVDTLDPDQAAFFVKGDVLEMIIVQGKLCPIRICCVMETHPQDGRNGEVMLEVENSDDDVDGLFERASVYLSWIVRRSAENAHAPEEPNRFTDDDLDIDIERITLAPCVDG